MGFFGDSDKLLQLQRQLTVVALVVLIGLGVLQISSFFADLLRILALSLLLSYLVINAVDFLDKYLRNRALAVVLVYIGLAAAAIVAGFFVIPAMVYQVTGLVTTTVDALPELLEKANHALEPLQQRFQQKAINIRVIDVLTTFVTQLPKPDPAAIVTRVSDMALGTMTWVMYSVSIAVVTFYFLLDGHNMKEAIIKLFPARLHAELNVMAAEMDRGLQAFFKGQIVLAIAFGFFMLGVYFALKVEYALLLSAFLAICEILPVIGPPIGFFPAILVVAFHGSALPGDRWLQILILTAIFAVLQQIKDSVVGPRYMGNVIGMHPVLILVAIMIGARLDGMLGIIIALPAASVLSVLFAHLPLGERALHQPVTVPVGNAPEPAAEPQAGESQQASAP